MRAPMPHEQVISNKEYMAESFQQDLSFFDTFC